MASISHFALEPAELLSGSPAEADHFLVYALWHSTPASLRVEQVRHWSELLRGRGIDFASHVSACQYWLYEHAAGYSPWSLKGVRTPRATL